MDISVPKPDEFSVTQYSLNVEVGVQINVIEGEHERPKIITPDEPGRYYYTVHIQWHEEAVGEAYYVFSLHVKDDS